MDSTRDTPWPRDATAHMPDEAGERIPRAADRLPWRKRVIVGSARASEGLGDRLFRDWPVGHGRGVAVLDARRIDGQLPTLKSDAPDEVYFDLGAKLDEQVVTRVGAALLMDGVCVHLVVPQAGRPPVHVRSASVQTHAVISLHLATRSGIFGRVLSRLLGLLGVAPKRARTGFQNVEEKCLREELHILLRTLPAVIQQRDAL